MRDAKKLALIAAGYCVAVGGGIAAVAVNEMLISEDVQQSSGGMVAFGDMIVFVLVAGVLSLAPTWFLLKLCVEKSPRALVAAAFMIAALGPASWLAVRWLAAGGPNPQPLAESIFSGALGLFIAFVAIPRIVFGPVLLMIEGVTFFLVHSRFLRAILVVAMLMDLIPLSLFALHIAATTPR